MRQVLLAIAQVALIPLAAQLAAPAPLVAQGKPAPPSGSTPASAAPRAAVVRVSAIDYAFKTPATIPAGLVVFELDNDGSDLHQLAVLELPANRTLSEFLDTYHNKGIIPAWMAAVGQTQVIAAGQEALLALRVKPGRYILACLMPARDGRAHTEKGMVWQVTAR